MANRDNSAIVRKAWLTRKRNARTGGQGSAVTAGAKAAAAAVAARSAGAPPPPPKPKMKPKPKPKRKRRFKTLAEFQAGMSGGGGDNFGGRVGGEVKLSLKGGHSTVYKRKR